MTFRISGRWRLDVAFHLPRGLLFGLTWGRSKTGMEWWESPFLSVHWGAGYACLWSVGDEQARETREEPSRIERHAAIEGITLTGEPDPKEVAVHVEPSPPPTTLSITGEAVNLLKDAGLRITIDAAP